MYICVVQSCPTLCDPMDFSPPARLPGEGNGNPLQILGLENPMDWGAWRATVHGIVNSWTWLSIYIYIYIYTHTYIHRHTDTYGASLVTQMVKNLHVIQEAQVWSLVWQADSTPLSHLGISCLLVLYKMVYSSSVAIIKYARQGALNNRNFFFFPH